MNICPKCGEKTALLNSVCEHCGCKIKKCIECGNVVDESCAICDYCGFDFSLMETVKEERKQDYIKTVNNNAASMVAYTERINKYFRWAGNIGSIIATALLIVAVYLLFDFGNYNNKSIEEALESLANASKLPKQVKGLLILSLILYAGAIFLNEFRTLLSASIIASQIDAMKFDYISYYKNIKLSDKGEMYITSANLNDLGDLQLIEAIRYKTDPSEKIPKIIKKTIMMLLYIVGFVFVYLGLSINIENYIATVITESTQAFQFAFNVQLIVAAILIIVSVIMDFITDKDAEKAEKWIKEIKSK